MANESLSREKMQQAVNALAQHKTQAAAADALGLPHNTYKSRLKRANMAGIFATVPLQVQASPEDALRKQVQSLTSQLRAAEKERLSTAYVKQFIFGLKDAVADVAPAWLTVPAAGKGTGAPGVPVALWSDWHWGEVVSKSELNGVNEFNLDIARQRARTLFTKTVSMLKNYTVNPTYPGIVVNLGGDMVTGDIHEELTATNDAPIMPTVVDLYGILIEGLTLMANEFGNVFVPCVTGNHGRNTKKIQKKQRAFTNFDWLVYQLLAKHFENDPRVTFYIPDGPDALYSVYGHRYLLTHGDQFRGGDGIIGPLGPLTRGNHKKRSRNSQISMDYDTMLCGHFHTLMMLPTLIVNGSLKGYDEYAFDGNFGFEVPAQALWLTHPDLGISISMPVYTERKKMPPAAWVSVQRVK